MIRNKNQEIVPDFHKGFRDSLTSIFVFVRTNALLATKNGTWFLGANETQIPEYKKRLY